MAASSKKARAKKQKVAKPAKAAARKAQAKPAKSKSVKKKLTTKPKDRKPAKKQVPQKLAKKSTVKVKPGKLKTKPKAKPAKPAKAKVIKLKEKIVRPAKPAAKTVKTRKPVVKAALPPPPPKPEPRKVSAAMRAFEHAMRVFNRRQFEEAKALLSQVVERFPHDVEITSRAQMYLQVCQQKLAQAPPPQVRNITADELYDRGVFALNLGDLAHAQEFFEKALRLNPNEPHFLYSLAATYARSGAHEQALDYLRRSIQLQPRFRSQAYDDVDFDGLREERQFQELLGLTSPFDLFEARRD